MKFLPFKAYSSSSKVKITRKKTELDMSLGEFYPGEGHRSLIKCDLNACTVTIFGGSRRGEDASYPLSNRLIDMKLISTPDDVYIEKIENRKTSGASLPALTSPGFTWGLNDKEMCIWGGLQLDTYQASDDLYYIKETIYRRSTILDIRLYTGSSDFSFDNLDHIAIKNDILIQHSTPKARAGHSLNNVPNSSHLVLFGGYYLPNREIQSASSANPFVQRCDDDNFYILDLSTVTWKWLDLPSTGPRCFHTADFINEQQLAIVGGLLYKEDRPTERHPLNHITILNVIDVSKMEFSISNYTFEMDPTYLSYHGSVVFNKQLLVYGGYIQHEPHISINADSAQKLCHEMFIFDFNMLEVSKVASPKENAVAGNSMAVVDEATILIVGGSVKNYCVFTAKPFTPSPCDIQTGCIIQDSPEVSPIQWIQCEDVCKEWHHLFCTGLKSVPKGKYLCKHCLSKKSKKK